MKESLKRKYSKLSKERKISILIFLFTLFTFSLIGFYVESLDDKSQNRDEHYDFPIARTGDSCLYAEYGQRLSDTGVYADKDEQEIIKATNWPVGYPLTLSASWFLTESFLSIVFVQIFLAAVTAVLIFKMALRFVPVYFAIIPSAVFSLDPSIGYYNTGIFTDGLFMSLMAILVYGLFFISAKYKNWFLFLCLGILLGYSSLVRSISQYLVIALPVLYLGYTYLKKDNFRSAVASMAIFTVTAVAVIYPWVARNHEVIGKYTLGTIGDKMLMNYYVADFLTLKQGTTDGDDFAQSDAAFSVKEGLQLEAEQLADEYGGDPTAYYGKVAVKHIFEDPVGYTRFHILGSLSYFLGGSYRHFFVSILGPYQKAAGQPFIEHENLAHRMTEVIHSGSLKDKISATLSLSYVLIEVTWRLLLLMLAAIAVLFSKREHQPRLFVLLLLIGYFWFLTGPSAMTRYRIVSEPWLLTLATVGAWLTYNQLKELFIKRILNKNEF